MSFKRRLVIVILLFIFIKLTVYTTVIPSASMKPTLLVNDYVVYLKTKDVEVGDIVLFQLENQNSYYTKRIVAKEDDTVKVEEKKVLVNKNETDLYFNNIKQGKITPEIKIKEDCFYMMGDNREKSADSRYFGQVNKDNIRGKYLFKIPFGKIIKRR
jgi:signal peptidase I